MIFTCVCKSKRWKVKDARTHLISDMMPCYLFAACATPCVTVCHAVSSPFYALPQHLRSTLAIWSCCSCPARKRHSVRVRSVALSRHLSYAYSTTPNNEPSATLSPTVTSSFPSTPATLAVTCTSIFIAVIVRTIWPFSSAAPSST